VYTLQGYQDSFNKSLESYLKIGITEEDYRALIISDLLRTKLFDEITADVKPFEDQVWARHILVADEATALAIRERLLRGEDFAALAAEFSTDTSNKDTGGDLGWFGKGQMVAEFETAAWAMKIGEISQPVKTQYGYHIIQVIGHENRPLTADAFDQLKQTAFNDWLTAARKQAEDAGLLTIFDIWKAHTPVTPDLSDLTQTTGQ
jgi:parvulin-like peptidyl-prolyl isomerase